MENRIKTNKASVEQRTLSISSSTQEFEDAGSNEDMKIISPTIKNEKRRITISPTIALPPLTLDLENKLRDVGILRAQKSFMYFWGSYLWQTTRGTPSKYDYHYLATSIVRAYPELKGGRDECGIVRTQLSIWIRNHRANLKKYATKRRHKGLKISAEQATFAETKPTSYTHTDVQKALKELEKKYVEGKNITHLKMLFKITLCERRQWIENESKRIVDIIKKYPAFIDYEIVLSEFLNLNNTGDEVVFTRINGMINQLSEFFGIEENNGKLKTSIVVRLYQEFSSKKNKNSISDLFIVKEVMMPTTYLTTAEYDAPRVVIYLMGEEISTSYIVADGSIKMKIENPTIERVVSGLLASYYAWHRNYPKAYQHCLQFFEHIILGKSLKSNTSVVNKFIRKLNNRLKDSEDFNDLQDVNQSFSENTTEFEEHESDENSALSIEYVNTEENIDLIEIKDEKIEDTYYNEQSDNLSDTSQHNFRNNLIEVNNLIDIEYGERERKLSTPNNISNFINKEYEPPRKKTKVMENKCTNTNLTSRNSDFSKIIHKEEDRYDPDLNFFRSVLPDMKKMSTVEKLRFKQSVLSSLADILSAQNYQ